MGLSQARFFAGQGFLAFLPAAVVLLVARSDPRQAADLSVTLGVIGAIFSVSYFGQRGYVAVRGFEAVPCREAVTLRASGSVVAGGLTLVACRAMGIDPVLAAFAVALKLSEGILDLWVGVRIRLSSDRRSSRAFLRLAALRAALIGVPLAALGGLGAIRHPLAVPYLLALALALYAFAHLDTRRAGVAGSYALRPRRALRHLWEMRSFAAATAACAVLSALPRIVAPYSNGATYHAAALALSIVPVFGLACQALWLGNVRRLTASPRRQARAFSGELAAVVGASVLAWPAWRWLARSVYGLGDPADQRRFAVMILAGVALTCAIGLSNLFKLTARPRNEALNYLLGIAAILLAVFPLRSPAWCALLGAAALMVLRVSLRYEPTLRRAPAGAPAPHRPPVGRIGAGGFLSAGRAPTER